MVGIGASAGGLEAFTGLLSNLSVNTGMAFVLVQHLRQDAESMLSEILGRVTAMPVVTGTEGLKVLPDHIYVMSGAADLGISRGRLVLVPRIAGAARHLPIDRFFKSLATDQGEKAIGVVLSGAGSDGVAGLAAIKGEGGVTLVQDPSTAKQDDMPRHAIESGAADFVLDPAGIAVELARLGKHPYLRGVGPVVPLSAEQTGEDLLREVFLLLRRKTGTDFSGYKRSTFNRRLARRMLLRKIESMVDYLTYLRETPEEVEALYQDVLIMVTEFFRDPETFEYLKGDVFPRLLAGREPGDPLRVWVVGCSSGQEAYSLAIVLLEFLGENHRFPIQIFATDVNEKDIGRARVGLYPSTIAQEVSPERLRRFFTDAAGGYRVNKDVREMCTFATHDLTRDPPFSNIDLISCRNVLIYFDTVLKERVTPVFHYALRPGGRLVLGRSETLGRHVQLFELVDKQHHVYVKKQAASALPPSLLPLRAPRAAHLPADSHASALPERPLDSHDVGGEADRILAQAYAPASVVIDDKYQVLHFRGQSAAYLEHPAGKATFDLFQMAREGLRYQLRHAVEEARESMRPVRTASIRLSVGGVRKRVDLEVTPFTSGDHTYFVISFHEPDQRAEELKGKGTQVVEEASASEATLLRKELEASREHLQSIITEKDVSTEELRAAYEEIQSSNEELQSTNEELETAKEELQSINEELTTVNEELQTRNHELGRAYDDLSNLLASVGIPVVMLDDQLRIRRFTPGTEAVIRVIRSDIGRPITDLGLKLDLPDLEGFLRSSIDSVSAAVREVQDEAGRWYSVRVRPYKTAAGLVEGAIVSFVDVDELKRSLDMAEEAKELSDALNEIGIAIRSTFELTEIMRRVMVETAKALRADSAAIVLASGPRWHVRYVHGGRETLVGARLADADIPQAVLSESRRTAVVIEDARTDSRVNQAFMASHGIRSQAVVPLLARDEALGVLLVNHESAYRRFTQAQLDFLGKLAVSVSLALENGRLYEGEKQAAWLSGTLNEIMAEIVATRDLGESMGRVLTKAAGVRSADRSLVSFRNAESWVISNVHGLPHELVGTLWGSYEAHAFPVVGASFSPLVVPEASKDPRVDRAFAKTHGISSLMVAPLLLRGELQGLLAFGYSSEPRAPSEQEKSFVSRLAAAIPLALENSLFFETEHRLADSMRARLNPPVPRVPGLEIGAVARMASDLEQVGGDFYSVFSVDDGRVALLIGDVTGKGLAAAGVTEAIRSSMRAVASIEASAGFIFDTINSFLSKSRQVPRVATAHLAIIDPKTGDMEIAVAGHPPGIICGNGCRLLQVIPAPPLGFGSRPYEVQEDVLQPGETLILYTDGLTDARHGNEFFGEARLLDAVERLAGETAQDFAEKLIEEVVQFAHGKLRDDIAIVVARRPAQTD